MRLPPPAYYACEKFYRTPLPTKYYLFAGCDSPTFPVWRAASKQAANRAWWRQRRAEDASTRGAFAIAFWKTDRHGKARRLPPRSAAAGDGQGRQVDERAPVLRRTEQTAHAPCFAPRHNLRGRAFNNRLHAITWKFLATPAVAVAVHCMRGIFVERGRGHLHFMAALTGVISYLRAAIAHTHHADLSRKSRPAGRWATLFTRRVQPFSGCCEHPILREHRVLRFGSAVWQLHHSRFGWTMPDRRDARFSCRADRTLRRCICGSPPVLSDRRRHVALARVSRYTAHAPF